MTNKTIRFILALMVGLTGTVTCFMLVSHAIKINVGDWGLGGFAILIVSYLLGFFIVDL